MIGKVIEKYANNFVLDYENKKINCFSRGKIKLNRNIIVGDNVNFSLIKDVYVIEEVLPKKNHLIRPPIANIDYLIIVQSVKNPDLSLSSLINYFLFYEYYNISKIIIFLSKRDLLDEKENRKIDEIVRDLKKDKYSFFDYKNKNFINFKNLFAKNKNKTFCFCGQSGVGKSTLINKLLPKLLLKTSEVSKNQSRGKHTTTTIKIYKYNNNYIADSPGFSMLSLEITKKEMAKTFYIYDQLSKECFFRNCSHTNEKECAIIKNYALNKISKIKYEEYLKEMSKLKK